MSWIPLPFPKCPKCGNSWAISYHRNCPYKSDVEVEQLESGQDANLVILNGQQLTDNSIVIVVMIFQVAKLNLQFKRHLN